MQILAMRRRKDQIRREPRGEVATILAATYLDLNRAVINLRIAELQVVDAIGVQGVLRGGGHRKN